MLHGRTDNVELLADIAYRLTPAGQVERLANPLGNRLVTCTRDTLNFTLVGILHNYLDPFSHRMSLVDSST